MMKNWFEELPVAITVSDVDGKILDMNEQSTNVFNKYGGKELVGKSLYDCHNAHSREIMAKLMAEGKTNVYTIEKNGQKKMIFQAPWREEGKIAGLVEFSFVLPQNMLHFKRD